MCSFRTEVEKHLKEKLIPFWKNMRDAEFGGFYGYLGFDLALDKRAEKGCILNSRILWFFSVAARLLCDDSLREYAGHSYHFMRDVFEDKKEGGLYWSVSYDGEPLDTTKHTYNQAFAIYGLAEYYELTGDSSVKDFAFELFDIVESKMRDKGGYLEAFDREFKPASNEKLSENGVMAERTMNTLLHVMEAYTELYRVSKDAMVKRALQEALELTKHKVFDEERKRLKVFFDKEYNSLIDLYSYGHDIEAAWLVDYALEVLSEDKYTEMLAPVTDIIAERIYEIPFDGSSMPAECEDGRVLETRIWWVEAESINGFVNAYLKHPEKTEYKEAALKIWDYIKKNMIDKRDGSEWYAEVSKDGKPIEGKPIVEPWKCPYHNGRMCLEMLRRNIPF
ncbi:MAG: AGE family epimerase/isomerase [Lachnospiraceae bacterium]|nr:AGE family epimerase/isomerase [Lachnospiraceae bacterium]